VTSARVTERRVHLVIEVNTSHDEGRHSMIHDWLEQQLAPA